MLRAGRGNFEQKPCGIYSSATIRHAFRFHDDHDGSRATAARDTCWLISEPSLHRARLQASVVIN